MAKSGGFPLARFAKFCAVGGSGVFVNLGVYHPLRYAGVVKGWALAVSIAVSILTNFVLNEVWTFRDCRIEGVSNVARRLGQFYVVSLGGASVQWGISMFLIRALHVNDTLAILAGIAVATAFNFTLNLLWTWRRSEAPRHP